MHRPIPVLTQKQIARFTASYAIAPNGCWEWQRTRHPRGYGLFSAGSINLRAHRVAFRLFKDAEPGALHVCHACDNPSCVNPDHLWLGTQSDNISDCVAKGRHGVNKGRNAISGKSFPRPRPVPQHCIKCGHNRTDDYIDRHGVRRCRVCVSERCKRRNSRK